MPSPLPVPSMLMPPRDGSRHESSALQALLDFPCLWLPDLPEPICLRLLVAGAPVPVVFDTSARGEELPVLATRITFERDELRALVVGVEADRIWHREFLGFCFEKWRKPSFRLGLAEALAGATPDREQAPWSVARVLRRLQASTASFDRHEPAVRVSALNNWSAAA